MRYDLRTSGYPRSGNTYLNYCIKNLYFPNEEINKTNHTVTFILKRNKTIVPFRNPLDSLASFKILKQESVVLDDIKYYLRFTSQVLNNLDKVVLVDFNYFTNDLEYIKKKIKDNFGFDPVSNPTIEDIKKSMDEYHIRNNLPRNNKEILDLEKSVISQMPEFQECIDLYLDLKNAS